ncbi:ATP-dependent DNA helicase [Alkalihalobacillus oceani]|uniref:ATP-dependent DNA helicase n=1 Tax=Halalkalibacter oceani TaxID=1653776 RepID=UPI002040E4DE|nr:ATP-dependent DNA helicase [Halalkalibacter oceani]MCM3760788.1 ATP-dependent DNA helicase [Halalkalibacter oceani]
MKASQQLPFSYELHESFFEKLNEWIGDVFYDLLPEAGMELRDEQIFMAFQMEKAFREKKVMFAEAGVGTGKTIVYLLYAICYARYMRKPAIIACADESLIEQLVKKDGDIEKLSNLLGLSIDVRLAKSREQYLCLEKLEAERSREDYPDHYDMVYDRLPSFVHTNQTMQAFTPYGDRKQYPELDDEAWNRINWDSFQDCFVCQSRHRCGQTLSRDDYRQATDLIICSHDFYMEHVWTYEARKREGQLPFLPEASAVVFDEGHLLEVAAQNALTYKYRHDSLEELLTRLLHNDVRERFAVLIEELLAQSVYVTQLIEKHSQPVPGTIRHELDSAPVLSELQRLVDYIERLEEELVFESELFTIDDYQLRIVEEHLEMIKHALVLYLEQENVISWVEREDGHVTLVIMPEMVEKVLKEKVFSKNIPFIFSSATLSVDGSFDYMASSLGVEEYLSFSVDSPFDYAAQMRLLTPRLTGDDLWKEKLEHAVKLLEKTDGSALLLFTNHEELQHFKHAAKSDPRLQKWPFLFEGDQEISQLISIFQAEVQTVLCAVSLWEGLDIPGPSLSNVIIWSLPFPPADPVFTAKRNRARDPYAEVDLPYMLLRLRQGIGRLIRTHHDQGLVAILSAELCRQPELMSTINAILPSGVPINLDGLNKEIPDFPTVKAKNMIE